MFSQLKKQAFLTAALFIACGFATVQSDAATITLGNSVALSTLLKTSDTNPNIQVGDKKFDTFTYFPTGDMPSAVNVNVIPIQDSDGNYGIRLQGAFADLQGGGGSDALLTYKVAVTDPDPNRLIIDAHLAGNPDVLGGTGLVSITESFMPDSPNMMNIHDAGNGTTPVISDSTTFSPGFRELNVQKDIMIFSGNLAGTLSFVDQTFSQTPGTVVPEASAAAMVLIGCAGMSAKRRRRETAEGISNDVA